jgi:hypothetical protein
MNLRIQGQFEYRTSMNMVSIWKHVAYINNLLSEHITAQGTAMSREAGYDSL